MPSILTTGSLLPAWAFRMQYHRSWNCPPSAAISPTSSPYLINPDPFPWYSVRYTAIKILNVEVYSLIAFLSPDTKHSELVPTSSLCTVMGICAVSVSSNLALEPVCLEQSLVWGQYVYCLVSWIIKFLLPGLAGPLPNLWAWSVKLTPIINWSWY